MHHSAVHVKSSWGAIVDVFRFQIIEELELKNDYLAFGSGKFDIRATMRIWGFLAYILEDVSEPNGKDSAIVSLMGIGKGIKENAADLAH